MTQFQVNDKIEFVLRDELGNPRFTKGRVMMNFLDKEFLVDSSDHVTRLVPRSDIVFSNPFGETIDEFTSNIYEWIDSK